MRRWASLASMLLLLNACGGGNGGASQGDASGGSAGSAGAGTGAADSSAPVGVLGFTGAQIEAAKSLPHMAGLGILAGSTVEVRDAFDPAGKVLFSTTTDADGRFSVTLPDYGNYGMFLVTISGGQNWDVAGTGTRDAKGTDFKGSLNAVVDPNDLVQGSIAVSVLSDAAFRLLGGDLSRFDASGLNIELNRLAGLLLKSSLKGSSAVTSSDLLSFNATDSQHRAALAIDYESLNRPLAEGSDTSTLMSKYHSGANDITQAWRALLGNVPGLTPTLADMENKTRVKLQVSVSGKGSITGSSLAKTVDDAAPWSAVVARDGSTVSYVAKESNLDWRFDSWVGCTQVVGNRCDVTVDKDVAVVARFRLAQPTLQPEVKSLYRMVPKEGVTGIRFGDANNGSATIVTTDAALSNFLKTVEPGAIIQTGTLSHPMIKVTQVTVKPSSVSVRPASGSSVPVTSVTMNYVDAAPHEVYSQASLVADATSFAFQEVRAITLGDEVGGSVRTVMPEPDYTASVIEGSIQGNRPNWYVTLSRDGLSCRGYGVELSDRSALKSAWEAAPKTYPFTEGALANCVGLNKFEVAGDATDYVLAKANGEVDQLSGRSDGSGKLAMRLPKLKDRGFNRQFARGEKAEQVAEPVWVAGVGVAVPLGNSLYLAARDNRAEGFRLLHLEDTRAVTSAQAIARADSDCSLKGLSSACAMLASLDRERAGLTSVGMIPLLTRPISVTLKKGALEAKISFSLNIDLSPKASFNFSIPGTWVSASVGADYQIEPELGLEVQLGANQDSFKVDPNKKKRRFDSNNARRAASKNKEALKKTLIHIDLGRAIPYAGAVLDLGLNLDVGVDIGGNVSASVKPKLTLGGDFGLHARYEWHAFRANDRDIWAHFNMPVVQPSMEAALKGTLEVEPYMEANLAAGIRGIAPEVGKVYVRGGVLFRGEVATKLTYAQKFRRQPLPDIFVEGPVFYNSAKYWENCSLDTRVRNPGSCTCRNDITHTEGRWWWKRTVVDLKCVQRGFPQVIGNQFRNVPQRCVESPELSLGVFKHLKAGLAVSSGRFAWPFNGWLSFINREFTFLDAEWPIWEYPQRDNQPENELVGCKDL